MKYCPGKTDKYRVAVVVSKKVNKTAPARNRIRRRVYEVINKNSSMLNNQDIVITIFDDRFLSMSFDDLNSTIKRQLKAIARSS